MRLVASLIAAAVLSACTATTPGVAPGSPSAASVPPPNATPEPRAASSVPPSVAPAAELVADVARAVPADASVEGTVDGLITLGHELHDQVAETSTNTVLSPLSIALAFGMVRAGAVGDTADEVDAALHFTPEVHEALNALEQDIVSRDAPPPLRDPDAPRDLSEPPQPPVVAVANRLFVQEGVEVKRPYLEVLAGHYGAGVRVVDFGAATAKPAIDAWVREQTAGRIEELFDEVPPETQVVLANAVYLKADWQVPFTEGSIRSGPFTHADGTVVTVQMMGLLDERMRYAEGDGWQAAEIPYAGDQFAMWIIVPEREGSPTELLAPEVQSEIGSAMKEGSVLLEFPKWDFATDLDLKAMMIDLGMELPFEPAADFSAMTDLDLSISEVIHRANITVDEWGTEAAAVTGVGMAGSVPPEPDVVVLADHPFAFVVRHTATGTPLFIGQVGDPTAE